MKKTQVNKKSIVCLLGLLVLSCLIIFKNFLFGNQILAYTDIGSDTYDQYLMHYQSIINHIRDGNWALWDFNNGYGVNMFTYNMFNPFLMLLYLFGVLFGAESIYGILVYWIILHILLAGLVIYLFLSCFELSENAKVIASYAYALCGYMVVWGQHYQFGSVMIYLPLMLMAVELSLKKKNWYLGITVLCAIASMSSLYMAYMQFIVVGFYVLFHVAWHEKIFSPSGLKRIGKAYGSMILGIGIALFQLLPSAYLILNVSGRVSSDSLFQRILNALHPYELKYYWALLKRLLSSNLMGVNEYSGSSNYYEDPNVFLSALLIIAFVQFIYLLFKQKYTLKQKVILIVACVSLGFVLLVPLGSLIFNGFAYAFSRHTFVCIPFAVWMMAYVLHKIYEEKKCNIPLLIISVAGVLAGYAYIFLFDGKKMAVLFAALAAGMGCALFIYMVFKRKYVKELSLVLLVGCLVLTMSGDAFLAYSRYRITVAKTGSDYLESMYDEDVEAALEYIESIDSGFYRVEKDYTIGTDVSCLNSLAQNYRGVSTYNSTINIYTADFLQRTWGNVAAIHAAHYSFANGANENVPASLSNVKYILSESAELTVSGYELLKQFNNIYVYENMYTEDIGKFYTSTISTGQYDELVANGDKYDVLSDYLVCDTVSEFQIDETGSYEKTLVQDNDQVYLTLDEKDGLSINFDKLERDADKNYLVEFDISHVTQSFCANVEADGITTLINFTPTPIRVSLTISSEETQIRVEDVDYELAAGVQISNVCVYECEQNDLSELSEGISFDNPEKDSIVTGIADVKESGILMLAIPYEDGWHAYVDGEEVEIHEVDFGFCGIVLDEGKHEIEMRFKCPGFTEGMIGSGVFLLLTIAIWGIVPYCKRKNFPNS